MKTFTASSQSIKIRRKLTIRQMLGQGMSEYLIVVALIAVASIAVVGLFGGAARNQVAGLANEIAGGTQAGTDTLLQNANNNANAAEGDAGTGITLSNYGGSTEAIAGGNAGTTPTRNSQSN